MHIYIYLLMGIADKNSSIIHIIHDIAFSCEKVVLSESGEKYAQIKHSLQVKTVQNCSKQMCWWILFVLDVRGQQGMDFVTGGSELCLMTCDDSPFNMPHEHSTGFSHHCYHNRA